MQEYVVGLSWVFLFTIIFVLVIGLLDLFVIFVM